MSYGYLIITNKPINKLKERGNTFSLLYEGKGRYAYFRFVENNLYTIRNGDSSVLTEDGMKFLSNLYEEHLGKLIFCDVILYKNEGEMDFVSKILNGKEEATEVFIRSNKNLTLRKCYMLKKNGDV